METDCPRIPQNGEELDTDASRWEQRDSLKYNNCYAYAVNSHVPKRKKRMQPGNQCGGIKTINKKEYTCRRMEERLLQDFRPHNHQCKRKLTKSNASDACPKGMYKIAMLVDPHKDYHFYRQGNDGLWTHKRGDLKVFTTDAKGQPIVNPECASHDWGKYNYTDFCGYYCVDKLDPSHKEDSQLHTLIDQMLEDV